MWLEMLCDVNLPRPCPQDIENKWRWKSRSASPQWATYDTNESRELIMQPSRPPSPRRRLFCPTNNQRSFCSGHFWLFFSMSCIYIMHMYGQRNENVRCLTGCTICVASCWRGLSVYKFNISVFHRRNIKLWLFSSTHWGLYSLSSFMCCSLPDPALNIKACLMTDFFSSKLASSPFSIHSPLCLALIRDQPFSEC